jgi:hypothetical protein
MPKQTAKKRFSPGRRVLVGMGMQLATVISVADTPSTMSEYVHEVQIDGHTDYRKVVGCELQSIPDLDEDLQHSKRPSLHIENSHVANLNVGSQIGTINAALQTISGGGSQEKELAKALDLLTQAVLSDCAQTIEKQDILDVLSTIAQQAAHKPAERSTGTLKAALGWLPVAISTAKDLTDLWVSLAPTVKGYFGI